MMTRPPHTERLFTLTLIVLLAACSSADTGTGGAGIDAGNTSDSGSTIDSISSDGGSVDAGSVPSAGDILGDITSTADVAHDATGVEDAPPSVDTGLLGYAYLVIEPPAIDFGARVPGEVITEDLLLENAGTRELLIETVGFTIGLDAFSTNVTQTSLGPGQTKIVKVTFYADEEGLHEDTLRFESDAINAPELDVDIRGEVIEPVCEDLDGDGHGLHCEAGADCNESDPAVYVGAPEKCNGQDDDCDGLHDEDHVGLGTECEVGLGACTAPGIKVCAPDEETLTCSVNPVTGGNELCNELDDDCDGATDEDFPSKNALCSVGEGACTAYDKFICAEDGLALICNVFPGEPTEEICEDGIDNDCDGIVDEGQLEICDDGIDNDCDGETDESGSAWGEIFFARDYYYDTVAITPSNGDGTFGDAIPLVFPDQNRYSVHAVGDFNGDFYLDLVVLRSTVGDKIICSSHDDCGPGRRCFAGVCENLCTTDDQCDLTLGEACVDATATGQSNNTTDTFCWPPREVLMAVSSCEGDGIELTHLFTISPGERLDSVIDADGNGHLDFVGRKNWDTPKGFIWMNDGAGGFTRIDDAFDYSALISWSFGLDFQSKDMDGDGVVDLLAHRFDSGGSPPTRLYRFKGNGDGTFQTPVELSSKPPNPSNLIIADDFDGDGDHDIVAGLDDDGQPGAAWMLMNLNAPDGDAWVAPYEIVDLVPTYNSGGEHPGVGSGASYDFDGDRYPDLVLAWIPEECGSYLWGCTQV
ncbi:MAG: MopE-related protein, partial [Myxococcota bacterium]|nr:MopE-related protein [Myxococcota bacterium]